MMYNIDHLYDQADPYKRHCNLSDEETMQEFKTNSVVSQVSLDYLLSKMEYVNKFHEELNSIEHLKADAFGDPRPELVHKMIITESMFAKVNNDCTIHYSMLRHYAGFKFSTYYEISGKVFQGSPPSSNSELAQLKTAIRDYVNHNGDDPKLEALCRHLSKANDELNRVQERNEIGR